MSIIKINIAVISFFLCNLLWSQETRTESIIRADSIVVANNDTCKTESIQSAIDACLLLVDAMSSRDDELLLESAEMMEGCDLSFFSELTPEGDDYYSLDGHVVFNPEFAESILRTIQLNKNLHFAYELDPYNDVKRKSDNIDRRNRHHKLNSHIFTRTCFVKAGNSTKYSFASRGRQELAVVAEAGGLVTMKIHVTNTAGLDEYHSDTVDVKKGRPHRKTAFDLPQDKRNTVELEVVNCSGKDISFVVISN